DGTNDNCSWNCGVEGPTDDADINALRLRQIKNFLTILFVSHGTPMLGFGDEVGRSQRGNNNAYCQNNEMSWFDWSLLTQHADLLRFTRTLIRFRRAHLVFRVERFWTMRPDDFGSPIVTWHGVRLDQPDFGANSHSLAYSLRTADDSEHLH